MTHPDEAQTNPQALVEAPTAADRVTCRKIPEISDKEADEAVPAAVWRKALACGDQLDRFPCQQCGATNPSKCINPITPAQVEATRNYVNGYGYKAAQALARKQIAEKS